MTYPTVPLVPYDLLRPQIQEGDLLLCSGSATFSRLIQYATGSVWSHIGLCSWARAVDRLLVLESVESLGVRAVPLSHYVSDYRGTGRGYPGRVFLARHAACAALTAEQWCRFLQGAIDVLGYPYDTQEIIRIAARIVAPNLGLTTEEFATKRAYICSEYVWRCFQAIGVEVPADPRRFVAPADFAEAAAVTMLWEIALGTT